jgi:tetratricopeptide (TPR) repeat protein
MAKVLSHVEDYDGEENEAYYSTVLALKFLQADKYDDAKEAARSALAKEVDAVVPKLVLAAAYLGNSEYATAIRICRKVIADNKHSTLAYLLLASCLVAVNDLKKAIHVYNCALKINPQLVKIYQILIRLNAEIDDQSEALDVLKKSLRLNAQSYNARISLGDIYVQEGEYQAALQEYQRALNIQETATAQHKIGEIHYLEKRDSEAVKAFRAALEIDERRADTNYRLGLSLMRLERYCEAKIALKKALEISPPMGQAKQALKVARQYSKSLR